MTVHFSYPLNNFQIKALSSEQKKDFEIMDGINLSFLALDEIYNLSELIGIKYT